MILFFTIVYLKSTVRILSVKDGLFMNESGSFNPSENVSLFVDYVFDFKGTPMMQFYSSGGKTLTIKNKSLYWKNLKEKMGTKWSYLPLEDDAGLIVSDNGFCFKRFADEIKLEDCPANRDDWTDCYLFSLEIGIDLEKVNKCKRTIERAKDEDFEYDCGKKPKQLSPPSCKNNAPRRRSNYGRTDDFNDRNKGRYEDDNYSDYSYDSDREYSPRNRRKFANYIKEESSEESNSIEKKRSTNDQHLISSEDNELLLIKNLLYKFKDSRKNYETVTGQK